MEQPRSSAGEHEEITVLLLEWSRGSNQALDSLIPLVYENLRRLAASMLRQERPNLTLQATGLVHELYCKLVDQRRVDLKDRHQFYRLAAKLMRRIIVDYFRAKSASKRDASVVSPMEWVPGLKVEVLALDRALEELAKTDARKTALVDLRFFAGFSEREAAEILGVSTTTAERDWAFTRAWLWRALH